MPSKAFPLSHTHAKALFELIHSDLKEVSTSSYHKYKYFVTFLDDYSSHAWIAFLKKKSDAFQAMQMFKTTVEQQYNAIIKHWRFDGGGEFTKFEKELQKMGILAEKSLPHEQQQNGHAERFNRTIWDKAQCLHFEACLPNS